MDDIILGPHVPVVEGEPVADSVRRRNRAGPQQHGHFLLFAIGDPAKRDWHIPAEFAPAAAPPGPLCVGWAAVLWQIFEPTPNLQAEWEALHSLERHDFRQPAFGYLRYTIIEMFVFDLGMEMPEWVEGAEQDPETAYRLFEAYAESLVEGSGLTMQATLAKYPLLTMRVARLPWGSLDYALSLDTPASFMLTRLGARNPNRDSIAGVPSTQIINAWRRRAVPAAVPVAVPAAVPAPKRSYEDILLELPAKSEHLIVARGRKIGGFGHRTGSRGEQTEVDPLHVMRAIGFARFLRDTQHFSEAMLAAHEFECGDTEDMEVERDSSNDPSRHALQLAASRMDLVDCLLHRREFQADYEHDTLFAINAFSDGSPSSGEELQGMVIDVFRRDRDPERITLPGSTLPYSRFDAVSKSIALLHAFWLVAGPNFQTLAYVLSKVISVTTDFGTEKNIVTMLNCVLAYCLWMSGTDFSRCRDFVDKDHRWLPNALRVSDWSHSIGNMARTVAESHRE